MEAQILYTRYDLLSAHGPHDTDIYLHAKSNVEREIPAFATTLPISFKFNQGDRKKIAESGDMISPPIKVSQGEFVVCFVQISPQSETDPDSVLLSIFGKHHLEKKFL